MSLALNTPNKSLTMKFAMKFGGLFEYFITSLKNVTPLSSFYNYKEEKSKLAKLLGKISQIRNKKYQYSKGLKDNQLPLRRKHFSETGCNHL